MTEHMKGITCCGDCAHFDYKKRRCKRGFNTRNDRRNHFFDNCDLPDVRPVVHSNWQERDGIWFCPECDEEYPQWHVEPSWRLCPMCGARMDLTE